MKDDDCDKEKRAWSIVRKLPYTDIGIKRKKCIRCGEKANFQWQICSDGSNYRPICKLCDIKLNKLVLNFMRHPRTKRVMSKYG